MKGRLSRWVGVVLLCLVVAIARVAGQGAALVVPTPSSPALIPTFETYLEILRRQVGIPGLSAALVKDGHIVWERGFGYQNVEARIPATPDTPYPIADISQIFAATLLLQCVEQRHLSLDAPVERYGGAGLPQGTTLRQVLSHSAAPGGTGFKYDAERYAQLTTVMEWCAPQPYRKSVAHRLLERLAMRDSVPGLDLKDRSVVPDWLFTPAAMERYAGVIDRLAVPYKLDRRMHATRSNAAPFAGISATDGVISTVRDLAKFDAAIQARVLLLDETLTAAWTPASGKDQTALPTGLGWFVQSYRNNLVVWHCGVVPNGYSSLVVKLPKQGLSLILMANSDSLALPSPTVAGDLLRRSLFASLFLRLFT